MKSKEPTALSKAIDPLIAAHPRQSGLHALSSGINAFAARVALAESAQRTLDLQYYIWHDDRTGRLLIQQILQAADRGVRVRVLLDDLGTAARDSNLLALDTHPNIEVRLFNPIAMRSIRWLGAVLEFTRLNRRMHNKAFIADGEVAIVGGRNIGDEYFAANSELDFADLDVVAIGPVVREVSYSFDLYWNSRAALPMASLARTRLTHEEVAAYRTELTTQISARHDPAYGKALSESPLTEQLQHGALPFQWGHAWTVYDLPEKFASTEQSGPSLLPQLRGVPESTQHEIFIVSPYFVPGRRGVKFLKAMRKRGVRVVVFTNSLASTDVTAVHAGYERYRRPLLRAGVEIYESKSTTQNDPTVRLPGLRGSRRASLHAKTFAFDRRIILVGSMNLDPRSLELNTEMGIVFECPEFAARLPERLEREFVTNAYRLELHGRRITWVAHEGGETIRFDTEPGSTALQRFVVRILSWLPLERQL